METNLKMIRILLVDDHALFRESVASVLAAESDLEVAHCCSIREALPLLSQQHYDLVLLDHDLGSERASQFLPAARQSSRTVASGGTWLDRSFVRMEEEDTSESSPSPVFNDRQRKVLRFVMEGLSNKEIAWRLQISESYVKAILQSLFQKTGVRTRGQLVRVAFEQYENQL
jgi:two-component system nitrate/nitrite response regulator NarL